jgi:hypothetical protein
VTTYADLRRRPHLDDAVAEYERMQADIRAALDRELGPFGWYRVRGGTGSTGGHGVAAEFGARSLALAPWGFDGAIPDPAWPSARRIVRGFVAAHGFTAVEPEIDRPGHHVIGSVDPVLGAGFSFGSQRMTIMQVITGCHLPEEP